MIKGLDKYLTSGPPEDGFDNWSEDVCGHYISDEFYNKNEAWFDEFNGQLNKWLNKLYDNDLSPKDAAKIIERAFKLYRL